MRRLGLTLIAAIVVVAAVLSVYCGIQFREFLNSGFHNKGSIAQIRVASVRPMDNGRVTIQDSFLFNIAFLNPTVETMRLMRVEGYVWSEAGPLLAKVDNRTSEVLHPGYQWDVQRFDRYVTSSYAPPPNATLGKDPSWLVKYHIRLGPEAYQMTAEFNDQTNHTIKTSGPFSSSYDETYSTATMDALSIVNPWAIALEVIAVFLIIDGRVGHATAQTAKEPSHDVMLSIIFAAQGLSFILALQYLYWINSVIPKTSPEFFYAGGGAGAGIGEFFGYILMLTINGVGLLMLIISVGFFFKAKWAGSWGLFFAGGSLAISSACIYSLLFTVSQGAFSLYYVAVVILFSTVVVANSIVIYLVALRSQQVQAS